ncbi:MAG: hypothetical protein EU530_04365 [Promethearchaeota archaeon]|nr:MAG: hypothetical protein EU530_04365 [Candidatus Lokiarchaeota archaeon]
MCDDDELTTGFLTVLFGYLDSKFGALDSIKAKNNILLIKTVQDIYIALIIARFQPENPNDGENDRISLFNKRLENACKAQLGLIERKVGTLLLQLRIRQENSLNYKSLFMDIEEDFDAIIQNGRHKIGFIKKIFANRPITNALEIYKI